MKRIILTLSILFVFVVGMSCASASVVSLDYQHKLKDDTPLFVFWDNPYKDPEFIKHLMEEQNAPEDAYASANVV